MDAELGSKRRALEAERLALEEEELAIKRLRLRKEREELQGGQSSHSSSSILRLNVGGQRFDTTKETLLGARSSFFQRLLDDDTSAVRGAALDADGRLFIDRSPEGFRMLLEWLRGGIEEESLNTVAREMLLREALYYDVPALVRKLHGGYDVSLLTEDDRAVRAQAMALRQALSEGQPTAVAEADAALVSAFGPAPNRGAGEATCVLQYEGTPQYHGVPILFKDVASNSRARPSRLSCRNVADFRARLDLFAGPLFEGLDLTNLVVAGGAVLQALQLGDPASETVRETARDGSTSDIDLFIVADDEATARAAFDRVFAHLKARLATGTMEHRNLLVLRSPMAVTFYAAYPQRTLQVVLRRHSCIADVLFGFDIDSCQLAYDGQRVLATPSALRAHRTGLNLADPERSSAAYEKRLAKYASRGFAVAVPGLDLERVSKRWVSGVFTNVGSAMRRLSLTFGLGDMPAYSIDSHDVVGLPKLLVLAAVRTGVTENLSWRRLAPETIPEEPVEGVDCTFLVDLDKLGEYGEDGGRKHGEVWRKPTPPFPPPQKVLGRSRTRQMILEADDYMAPSVLLPYTGIVRDPADIESMVRQKAPSSATTLAYCWQLIRVPGEGNDEDGNGEGDPGMAHIEDASTRRGYANRFFANGADPKLPRHIHFPASNERGEPNPFERLPAESWFGEVYSASA